MFFSFAFLTSRPFTSLAQGQIAYMNNVVFVAEEEQREKNKVMVNF